MTTVTIFCSTETPVSSLKTRNTFSNAAYSAINQLFKVVMDHEEDEDKFSQTLRSRILNLFDDEIIREVMETAKVEEKAQPHLLKEASKFIHDVATKILANPMSAKTPPDILQDPVLFQNRLWEKSLLQDYLNNLVAANPGLTKPCEEFQEHLFAKKVLGWIKDFYALSQSFSTSTAIVKAEPVAGLAFISAIGRPFLESDDSRLAMLNVALYQRRIEALMQAEMAQAFREDADKIKVAASMAIETAKSEAVKIAGSIVATTKEQIKVLKESMDRQERERLADNVAHKARLETAEIKTAQVKKHVVTLEKETSDLIHKNASLAAAVDRERARADNLQRQLNDSGDSGSCIIM